MSNPHGLKVGQRLYIAPNTHSHTPCYETITLSIGRRWANIGSNGRVDLETLLLDGGQYTSPGKAYFSKNEYQEMAAKEAYWLELRNRLPVNPPAVSMETLKEIAEMIGLKP